MLINILILLESHAEYEDYELIKNTLPNHHLLICCLTQSAVYFCKKKNLNYSLPEDYFTDMQLKECRESSEWTIKQLVLKLNDFYHKKIGPIDGFKFEMGNYHFFKLYHFFGALHYRAFILSRIIEELRPDKILIAQHRSVAKNIRLFPVSAYKNCYLDLLLSSIYSEKVIPLRVKYEIKTSQFNLKIKARNYFVGLLRRFPPVCRFIDYKKNSINFSILNLLYLNRKKKILLLGEGGPWKKAFNDLSLRDEIDVLSDANKVSIPGDGYKNWFSIYINWEDHFCGFTVSDLAIHEMSRIKVLSEEFIAGHKKVVGRLKRNTKMVMYLVAPYARQQYILSVAKYLGLPRVCCQHGEMSLYDNALWGVTSELLYASHYFSYGNSVSQSKIEESKATIESMKAISIGSIALDQLRFSSNTVQGYILYASSKYMSYACGFVTRYADEYVNKNKRKLIEYFEKYLIENKQSQVIWKLNPEIRGEIPSIKTRLVKTVSDKKNFIDLLPDASFVILDRPSTTALEACMTNKPIFALLANKNWFPKPLLLFKKRAIVAYTTEELISKIDLYLTNGTYDADVNNREFIREYGAHLDDGLSINRFVSELKSLRDR